jgi:putative flavoprotein involved in K+ transport
MNSFYRVVIIGASQAGLAMGYYLKRAGISYLILGKEQRIGDVWRNRYDSLVLFTPRWFSHLPGTIKQGNLNLNGYADKDEIADELEEYAADQQLNSQLDTEVTKLTKVKGEFLIATNKGNFIASNVVIATGPFQQPLIPDYASRLSSAEVFQVHTSSYKNSDQLKEGNVLIVGCGNSGAQIATELAAHRKVYVSTSRAVTFVPREIMGKSIFWWFKKGGLYKFHKDTKLGRKLSRRGDPIIGVELKALIKNNEVAICPRTVQASHDQVTFHNGTNLKVSNVIWATGFTSDYSWISMPGVINEYGKPVHSRGVSKEKGLFFLGLPWQYNRGSALIGGVAADAAYITICILENVE